MAPLRCLGGLSGAQGARPSCRGLTGGARPLRRLDECLVRAMNTLGVYPQTFQSELLEVQQAYLSCPRTNRTEYKRLKVLRAQPQAACIVQGRRTYTW